MPAAASHRQPEPLAWFGTPDGQRLLAAEQQTISRILAAKAAAPTLWLHPGSTAGVSVVPAGLSLRASSGGFDGPLRCGVSLPLASDSFSAVVLQHVPESGTRALLEECARVLEPGGRLWLFTLNPVSPYRLRWRRTGLSIRGPGRWRRYLQAAGLDGSTHAPQWLGPAWRNGSRSPELMRAVCLLQADKRGPDLILTPSRPNRWQGGAVPA
ncbi:methyltransferase domain-containing protein [Pseudoxanthomonas sp.]|uniref:class I SAM-dependent methyltransferase n=1 Tax=Pseudoxanthomonas sp. TaxID=1871049 RepID=UPI00260E42B9|nr:methyltransferase domain-containing protein [Pseudoxanthomonas sp.]WDS36107.1 MAG: methyltransferase domain-containing protein [Pseudoxanthomonas sp.]